MSPSDGPPPLPFDHKTNRDRKSNLHKQFQLFTFTRRRGRYISSWKNLKEAVGFVQRNATGDRHDQKLRIRDFRLCLLDPPIGQMLRDLALVIAFRDSEGLLH